MTARAGIHATEQGTIPGYTGLMPTRILVVSNAVHPLLFRPQWHWLAHLRDVQTCLLNLPSGEPLPDLTPFTHVILTGSEASILQPRPWFSSEVQLIQDAVERGIPVLGSCFGHQMLVYALSGSGYVRSAEVPEIGWADVEMLDTDLLFAGLPNPWRTFVYHFDEVVAPPAPWVRLGRTNRCRTHVLRFGHRPVWGIQAHPEISSRKAKLFMRATLLMGRGPAKRILHALRNAPKRNNVAARIVHNFLDYRPTKR